MGTKSDTYRKEKKKANEVTETSDSEEFLPEKSLENDYSESESAEPLKKPEKIIEATEMDILEKESQWRLPSLRISLEVDLVCLALLSLALATRLHNLGEPNYIVFDELHYGRYVSLYTKGVFFFDAHPPLGKQLLYLAGRAAGYDGNFTFDRIGSPYTPNVPVKALRTVPAVSGSLLVCVTYYFMRQITASQWTAILAALLVLFENVFLAQSRFMLLECIQMLFGLFGVHCALRSTKLSGVAAGLWLGTAAFSLGCCFSVKYSGLYTYYLGVYLIGRQIWGWIGRADLTGARLLLSAVWRLAIMVCVPLCVYVGVFYAHLEMLPKAGPHDSVMTSAFQASLQGGLASITRGQPLHVAHGSQITLRHAHGRACWLHSHAHVYPVRYADGRGSSHQQQVTCYSFKDVNNWWIVKNPNISSLAVSRPPAAVRHGDTVQLLHGITSRALNSHDVAAPASPQSQEVSCYIDYNISMAAQNLWRVEIVNRDSDDATWDSIRSLVRLVHVPSGSALRFSGRQLPAWGFTQHEVVADKQLQHPDTEWNVEEHRYTKSEDRKERERELVTAEMIPSAATKLSFWEKLSELQYKMVAHAPDAPLGHMFASEPPEWPLLQRSIAYWLSPTSNAQIHLIGNLITWYAGSGAVLVFAALLALAALRRRRRVRDLPPRAAQRFDDAASTLFLGYLLHYLPYYFVDRTLFLHHYLPAYLFKILLLAYVIEHIFYTLYLREKTRQLSTLFLACVGIWFTYVVITYNKFTVLNYGNKDLTETDLLNLRWKDTWDFILHKRGANA